MRVLFALAAYVLIGAMAWSTLTDRNIRLVTLAVLLLLASKTVVHYWRERNAQAIGSE